MTGPVRVINLTQHDVVVYGPDGGVVLRVPASGAVARLAERRSGRPPVTTTGGEIPVFVIGYQESVDDLPDPEPGVVYVVSRITAAAHPRADLFFPMDEVRDVGGRVVGCRAWGQIENGAPHAADR